MRQDQNFVTSAEISAPAPRSLRSWRFGIGIVTLMAICVPGWAGAAPRAATSAPDAAYRQEYAKWKTEMVEDLKANWLPLAGLFWLKPGENRFGSDPSDPVALPAGSAPAQAGWFRLQGDAVTVHLADGVKATIAGKAVTEAALDADTSGHKTVLELGQLRMHVIKRGERVGIRVKDLNSAAVREFHGMELYPVDLKYRVTAKWVPSDGKKTVDVPNVLGDVTPTPVAGEAVFQLDGHELRLSALGGDAAKGLFFVFKDTTSGKGTYPPGRFLDSDAVVNGTVVLDFNKAYNPPCAVTPYATCPLPPKENRLEVAIPAGEKYTKAHH